MSFFQTHLVSLTVFVPLLFAALVMCLPAGEKAQIRALTFVGMLVSFAFSLWLYLTFEPSGPEFQLEYRTHWMDALGVSYHVGVDGLAVSLIALTGFLGPLVVLGSYTYFDNRVKEFHIALLVLQTAMIGALASLDLILFYIFWEAMLVPMYLLVGVWGSEDRIQAAVKFFIYTLVGSFLLLVALIAIYFIAQPVGPRSFDLATVYNALLTANRELSACTAVNDCSNLAGVALHLKTYGPWLFFAFALAFAIKVPMFPVHTWLPDAHVQAPMAGSMILAGVMLKMGSFGFWRFAVPLFPVASREARTFLAVLAVIGIVYGALMCLAQRDIKKLIAYSSVSHLGYVMLGMFAFTSEGASGAAYQMLNHGISTGALFLLFGLLYERRHSRLMSDYGGIAKVMPVFTAFFLLITFSSIAVPGTNGFIGEFLILLGTFKSSLGLGFGVFGALGVILGAAYMLWMVQRVFFGELVHRENQGLRDFRFREVAATLPFAILVLVMGLHPQPFLDRLARSSELYVARARYGDPEARLTEDRVRMTVAALPAKDGAGKPPPTAAAPAPREDAPSRQPAGAPPRAAEAYAAPDSAPLLPDSVRQRVAPRPPLPPAPAPAR